MEHLVFLFNLVTLVFGLGVAAALFRAWRRAPRPLGFWQFLHFSGFTFTMVVAALDAYSVVNLGVGESLTRFWSSLVLIGVAAMVFTFPHLERARSLRPRTRRFSWFWLALAAVPIVAAGLLVTLESYTDLLFVIALAFVPFWASVLYGLGLGSRHRQPSGRKGWIALFVLVSLGGAEVWWILDHPPEGGYIFLTLPLAYSYTAWTTWHHRVRSTDQVPMGNLAMPEALVSSLRLTPREREMADGILRGLANKELAYELGLSEHTVRNHIVNLYRKLGIQKRLDLVLLVQRYQPGSG